MNNNDLRIEPDAIELSDETTRDLWWAACVNLSFSDSPGSLVIGRQRYANRDDALVAAQRLADEQRARFEERWGALWL